MFSRRYWRVGQVDVHQADEDHPRSWLSRWGEEDVHQAGLPEHLHGHAVHDQSHGPSQDPVRGLVLYGMFFVLCWKEIWTCGKLKLSTHLLSNVLIICIRPTKDHSKLNQWHRYIFTGKGRLSAVHRLRDCHLFRSPLRGCHQGPVERSWNPGHYSILFPFFKYSLILLQECYDRRREYQLTDSAK